MAVFRGTDRIRRATVAVKDSIRRVRSISLKGITFVNKKLLPYTKRFTRSYKGPIIATIVATIGVATVAVGSQHYVNAHMTDYYQVYVKGVPVGEISSSAKVDQWLANKAIALKRANTPILQALDDNQVSYEPERAYKLAPDDESTLKALAAQVSTHPIGVEIRIEGQVVGVVRDQATADALLARVKNHYVPAEAAQAVQVSATKSAAPRVQTLAFTATAAAEPTTAETAAEEMPTHLVKSVQFIEPVGTANVSLSQPKVYDPESLFLKLTGGGEEAAAPILNVQTVEELVKAEAIKPGVEYQKSDELRKGTSKVLRNGKEGEQLVTYQLTKLNGEVVEEEIIDTKITRQPVSKIIVQGTKVVAGVGTGKFSWPVSGYRITSKMGKRWGRMHNGIDLIGRSNIMAADNGVVEFSGYKSGLGNAVIIDHKNGYKTVYGHMKSLNVKKGQTVQKGDSLGVMGSTGNSTGTHLHFEIHLKGKVQNPLNYL